MWEWRNIDALQELPHADAAPNVHTNVKDKLRPLLLTPPFAKGLNPGPFATLSTIQPLSHMWLLCRYVVTRYLCAAVGII